MSKSEFISKASQDKVTAMLLRALGGGVGAWSLAEADKLERRASHNMARLSNRQVTRGTSRVAME